MECVGRAGPGQISEDLKAAVVESHITQKRLVIVCLVNHKWTTGMLPEISLGIMNTSLHPSAKRRILPELN